MDSNNFEILLLLDVGRGLSCGAGVYVFSHNASDINIFSYFSSSRAQLGYVIQVMKLLV